MSFILYMSCALLIRAIISNYSYSGYNTPPMYGDFEAQRHWQEITVNLPISHWYENTTDNDLQYWGLDYPPLTAYHSYAMGKMAKFLNISYVELHKSRGLTDDDHKHFMRTTVLLADLLIYLPALMYACNVIYQNIWRRTNTDHQFLVLHRVIAIMYPGQILIDNGHFQYNNVSLGLATLAITLFISDKRLLGAVCFVLALNYKQMELYHALPIFCYLLANCFKGTGRRYKEFYYFLLFMRTLLL